MWLNKSASHLRGKTLFRDNFLFRVTWDKANRIGLREKAISFSTYPISFHSSRVRKASRVQQQTVPPIYKLFFLVSRPPNPRTGKVASWVSWVAKTNLFPLLPCAISRPLHEAKPFSQPWVPWGFRLNPSWTISITTTSIMGPLSALHPLISLPIAASANINRWQPNSFLNRLQ